LLEDLYADVALAVDNLPYTEEMERLHRDFVQQSGVTVSVRDVYKALKNLGRQGRLGGKFRSPPELDKQSETGGEADRWA
jgi:hypothetical protein